VRCINLLLRLRLIKVVAPLHADIVHLINLHVIIIIILLLIYYYKTASAAITTTTMGVDPWVDRGTFPPYFLKWRGLPVFCPPYFLGVDIVCYLKNLILTETPCFGVHCSNFHEI